ncbi:hypothetical protein I5S78_02840 [Pseudomonas putida]|uniref:hypothetical protein n=1 Tax=Pseudomonas putida TaxID=303 RepID=UPI0018D87CC0|nr:hypothetical protein [Pseudomonas putida]MBH3415303.1 hypothetical protein [Pseudomonas putida]
MKTISELPAWSGDVSMRLHAHKPGSSEGVSIDQVAAKAVKVGDIVLKPRGTYEGLLECNGSYLFDQDLDALKAALNFKEYGATRVSLNENSEARFGTELYSRVFRSGQATLAKAAANWHVFQVGNPIPSDYPGSMAVFKTDSHIYYGTAGTVFVDIGGVALNATFESIAGAAETSYGYSVLAVVDSGVLTLYKADDGVTFIKSGTIAADVSKPMKFLASGDVYAQLTIAGVQGVYKIMFDTDQVATTLMLEIDAAVTHECIESGGSGSVFIYTSRSALEFRALEYEYSYSIQLPPLMSLKRLVAINSDTDYSLLIAVPESNSPSMISFDSGSTWSTAPTMSGYTDADFDPLSNEFAFVGGQGSTGALMGQTGSVQTNTANYGPGYTLILPNLTRPEQNLAYYIKK